MKNKNQDSVKQAFDDFNNERHGSSTNARHTFTIRVNPELAKRIKSAAKIEDVSINDFATVSMTAGCEFIEAQAKST